MNDQGLNIQNAPLAEALLFHFCGRRSVIRSHRFSKAFDHQSAALAKNFKQENILPLGPTRMEGCNLIFRGSKNGERVVFDGSFPNQGSGHSLHLQKFPENPPEKIDDMNSLIHQLSSPRELRIHPPLILKPRAAAMTITAASQKKVAHYAILGELVRPADCRMLAMVESDHELRAAFGRRRYNFLRLAAIQTHRFFAKDMRIVFKALANLF